MQCDPGGSIAENVGRGSRMAGNLVEAALRERETRAGRDGDVVCLLPGNSVPMPDRVSIQPGDLACHGAYGKRKFSSSRRALPAAPGGRILRVIVLVGLVCHRYRFAPGSSVQGTG